MIRTRTLALITASLTLVTLTGCGASDAGSGGAAGSEEDDTSTPSTGQGAAGVPVVPAEAGHVHGMAVNPADGLLYLGTHGGTLVVDGDSITPVGDSTVDLMGFTIAGPDHFYSSGHPGPDDDLPDPVGLIESTDGGQTWRSLSLAGESDFHTLGASADRIYGFDGQLVTSTDGREWTSGADGVAPVSLATDPGNPDRVIATTEHGPVRSEDAAATFTHLDGAPLLVFVAWPAAKELWGVGVDGTVHLSTDAGESWTARGTAGPPAAFTAAEDGTVVVATSTEIVASDDGGKTFEPVAEVTGSGH